VAATSIAAGTVVATASSATGSIGDVDNGFESLRYILTVNGEPAGTFSSCSPIGARVGTSGDPVVAGDVSALPFVCTIGMSDDVSFWNWFEAAVKHEAGYRRDAVITGFDSNAVARAAWTLTGLFPSAIEDVSVQNGVSTERIAFVATSIERGKV
jgi:hypothetical protein